jgi:hypothetical protein
MNLFGAGKPDHPMADRKNAQRVLAELPPQDLKAVEELAHLHESVSAIEGFKPEERAQRLAMIEEAAQPRLRKLGNEYLAATRGTRGSRAQETLLWTRIHGYWHQAAHAYARCIDPKASPEVILGGLRAAAQQLKWQQLRYGPVDAALWGLMNRLYAVGEARAVPAAKVEFLRAAMFSASSPDSLLGPELELADRVIAELAAGFAIARAPGPELLYWIDLGQPMAPARITKAALPQAPGLRCFGPGTASATLRGMLERLQAKRGVPPELKLGPEHDPEVVLGVMNHLALYWAPEPPARKHARHAMTSRMTVTHGFDGVLQALGGERDSLDFGATTPGESWTVENVSAGGFGAIVPPSKNEWLKVGALVAVQPDNTGSWMIGTVRRLNKLPSQETRVGVQTLSHSASLSRFALKSAGEAHGVILPGAAAGEAAIALRAGAYPPGENLESTVGGKQHVYMPQGVAQRGDDYEIVKFKEMIRE